MMMMKKKKIVRENEELVNAFFFPSPFPMRSFFLPPKIK